MHTTALMPWRHLVAAITLVGLGLPAAHAEIQEQQLRLLNPTTTGFHLAINLFPSDPWQAYMGFSVASKRLTWPNPFKFERNLQVTSMTASAAASLFLVKAGDVLTDKTLQSGKLTTMASLVHYIPLREVPVVRVGREFYLAIGVAESPGDGTFTYTRFSWARLRYNLQGVPELLDSAATVNEPGLIVGAKTPCLPCQTSAP